MVRASYCGRVGSFSHEATIKMFPNATLTACNTFVEAVTLTESGEVDFAVIPIENSTAGRVAEIHNLLPNVRLKIVKEKILAIQHNLFCASGNVKLEDIRLVKSHPQALMQCSKFIQKHKLATELSSNTAISAEELSQNQLKNAGVICSKLAGEVYNLQLLQASIQNNSNNFTTFIALSKINGEGEFCHPLTSLIVEIENKFGGIYEALGCFAQRNINLIKLESYIPFGVSQIAKFFITFEGSNDQKNVQLALEKLLKITKEIKNLGSYEADQKRFT